MDIYDSFVDLHQGGCVFICLFVCLFVCLLAGLRKKKKEKLKLFPSIMEGYGLGLGRTPYQTTSFRL